MASNLKKINSMLKGIMTTPVRKSMSVVGVKKFHCSDCNVVHVVKTNSDTAKCRCGATMGRVLQEANIGKAIKHQHYSEILTKGTEFFTLHDMRKVVNSDQESMRVSMLRKYGDLAINDKVRVSKCIAERITKAIEKYGPQQLDDNSKKEIESLSGTVSGFNARKNEVRVTWDPGAGDVVAKYNTGGFDFFDLNGSWSDWDLDRIIQMSDVGKPGTVQNDSNGGGAIAGPR